MARFAPNKMPVSVMRRYFELIREGVPGVEAALGWCVADLRLVAVR